MEEPLIWTTKGNLPIKDLDYKPVWTITDDYIKFEEIYFLNNEEVKHSCNVYMKKGLEIGAALEKIGECNG